MFTAMLAANSLEEKLDCLGGGKLPPASSVHKTLTINIECIGIYKTSTCTTYDYSIHVV